MFHSARIKLTLWYVLIAMGITAFFSILAYSGFRSELSRELQRQRVFIINGLPNGTNPPQVIEQNNPQLLQEENERIIRSILTIDFFLLLFSAVAGYFLAGETLRPIQVMVNKQNRFITDASHELRTPITAARTSIEVGLRDKKLTISEAKDLLNSTLEDITGIQTLAEGLLKLAQFQDNPRNVFEPVEIEKVLEDAAAKISPLAKQKQISLTVVTCEGKVSGNKENLTELFVILLDNAIKYSPEKSRVSLTAKTVDKHVVIDVSDNGIGIQKEDLGRIFDRFYRSEKSRSKSTQGYGLGLSIAQKIVQDHHGNISVQSTGKETTFTVKLPIIARA